MEGRGNLAIRQRLEPASRAPPVIGIAEVAQSCAALGIWEQRVDSKPVGLHVGLPGRWLRHGRMSRARFGIRIYARSGLDIDRSQLAEWLWRTIK